jgi:hypothetical protein
LEECFIGRIHFNQTIARVIEIKYGIDGAGNKHGIEEDMEPTPALALGHGVAGKQAS